jgi:exopolyphosphatase/guanosine-5'-triphosphate,3'-diphosphate pyrophosphatase
MARIGETYGMGRMRRRIKRAPTKPAYAAVDLGTNNCRLLAARPMGPNLRVVDSFSRIVRLGEGLSANGTLNEEAMERTIVALRICAAKIRRLSAYRVRNVATEACRRATNCPEFLARVEGETGLSFERISPEEEARLTVAGCASLFDRRKPFVLMFDIGGGSTEITWIARFNNKPPRILGTRSVGLGVMTIAERHGTSPLPEAVRRDIAERIGAELNSLDAAHGISEAVQDRLVQMIGTSGTVTTLGGIFLDLNRYDRARVDGLDVPFPAIERLIERIGGMSEDERARIPCVGHQRADLMIAGCALLDAIRRRWPLGRLRVADRGIREGILLEMMVLDGAIPALERIPVPLSSSSSMASSA